MTAEPEKRIPRRFALVVRKMGWRFTLFGWCLFVLVPLGLAALWALFGEKFLTMEQRGAGDILVVEGWIGREAIAAAADEFQRGGYRYVVTTGGLTSDGWSEQRWWYCEMAEKELRKHGVSPDKILIAKPASVDNQRTYHEAIAVRDMLKERGLTAGYLTIFTTSVHGRRSRLVFSKVFKGAAEVGVVSWVPSSYGKSPWWQSSQRSEDFAKETAGWLFELFWSSGRSKN